MRRWPRRRTSCLPNSQSQAPQNGVHLRYNVLLRVRLVWIPTTLHHHICIRRIPLESNNPSVLNDLGLVMSGEIRRRATMCKRFDRKNVESQKRLSAPLTPLPQAERSAEGQSMVSERIKSERAIKLLTHEASRRIFKGNGQLHFVRACSSLLEAGCGQPSGFNS